MKRLNKHLILFLIVIYNSVLFSQSVANDDFFFAKYYGNNNTSFTWNHTTTTSANRILFVFVTSAQKGGTASGISSVTYGGVAMTQLAVSEYQTALKSYLYYSLNPASGTNAIVVTPANSTDYFAAGSASFYNIMQTTPVFNANGGNATAASGNLTTPYINDVVLGFCGSDNNTNGLGLGQTQKFNAGSATRSYVNLSTKTSAGNTEAFSITLAGTADYEVILARLTPFGALPVTLSNYELSCTDEFTSLNWTSTSEHNNDYFTIEKSEDALNYSEIATINGNGTSNEEHHYQFTDEELNYKPFYYRLKQTDFDGKSETFKPLLSTCFDTKETTYFPNPVKDKIQINTSNDFIHATILSIDGKRIKESEINSSNNQIDLSEFSSGMYFIQLSNTNKETDFIKIIKE